MTHSTNPPRGDDPIQRRADAIRFARGSIRLEGFTPSPEAESLAQQWINGEITTEESIQALDLLNKK